MAKKCYENFEPTLWCGRRIINRIKDLMKLSDNLLQEYCQTICIL